MLTSSFLLFFRVLNCRTRKYSFYVGVMRRPRKQVLYKFYDVQSTFFSTLAIQKEIYPRFVTTSFFVVNKTKLNFPTKLSISSTHQYKFFAKHCFKRNFSYQTITVAQSTGRLTWRVFNIKPFTVDDRLTPQPSVGLASNGVEASCLIVILFCFYFLFASEVHY